MPRALISRRRVAEDSDAPLQAERRAHRGVWRAGWGIGDGNEDVIVLLVGCRVSSSYHGDVLQPRARFHIDHAEDGHAVQVGRGHIEPAVSIVVPNLVPPRGPA